MPTNNFKLFDQNKANMLSDTEYSNATQRLNGVQTGVASSQLNNKFAYQVSLVAYAIAQIMNQNGLDASDTLSVSAFVGNLGGALLQKVADKASSAEAVAGVLENKYISPATMKAAALLLSGGVMTGTLDMNNNQIINLPTPTSNSEPATKGYVDGKNPVFKKIVTMNSKIATFESLNLLNVARIVFNIKSLTYNSRTGNATPEIKLSLNDTGNIYNSDILYFQIFGSVPNGYSYNFTGTVAFDPVCLSMEGSKEYLYFMSTTFGYQQSTPTFSPQRVLKSISQQINTLSFELSGTNDTVSNVNIDMYAEILS